MAEFKKLSGRPQLKGGKRSKKIDVRFTEDEYEDVVALEVELGISKTELVRMRVLQDAGKIVINSKELLKHLDSIGAEMGRVGNNINQLAKHANTMRLQGALPPSVATKFNDLLEAYIRVQQSLETALRKIIRAMGR
jgi:mobilization protein NikA